MMSDDMQRKSRERIEAWSRLRRVINAVMTRSERLYRIGLGHRRGELAAVGREALLDLVSLYPVYTGMHDMSLECA
jgi:hypothetical protein